MRLEELDLGRPHVFRLAPVGALPQLAAGRPATLRSTGLDAYFILSQEGATVIVRGIDAGEQRRVEALLAKNPPRVCRLIEIRGGGETPILTVECQTFASALAPPTKIEIAVDDDGIAALKRTWRKIKDARAAIGRLEEECVLERGGGERDLFVSSGAGAADVGGAAFRLHGRTVWVGIERLDGPDGTRLYVRKIGRRHAHLPIPSRLTGTVTFEDASAAAVNRASLAELASLGGEESYLALWHKYGEIEGAAILSRARALGSLAFSGWAPDDAGQITFFLEPDASLEERLGMVREDDVLEVWPAPPRLLADERETWASFERARRAERSKGANALYSGLPQSVSAQQVSLRGRGEPAPGPGCLVLSLVGDSTKIERRDDARRRIRSDDSAMPHLVLLLEERPVAGLRPTRYAALSDRVRAKVFADHAPETMQEEAIRVAVNTPDIALIQGPPGTGKTTVVRAIAERLTELVDRSDGVPGRLLVSGFQHDAVENAIIGLEVNGLPTLKMGQRGDAKVDDLAAIDVRIDAWRQERVSALRPRLPPTAEESAARAVARLLEAYLLAPVAPIDTVQILARAAEIAEPHLARAEIDALRDTAGALAQELSGDDDLDRAALVHAVRALRVEAVSFADDGHRNAARLARLGAQFLRPDERGLVERAAEAVEIPGLDGLRALAALRRRLLIRLAPDPLADRPALLAEVARVLASTRDALDRRARASAKGPEAALLRYVAQLEAEPRRVRQAILSYSPTYAATCGQSVAEALHKNLKRGEPYDAVIVDEAARANPLDLLVPLSLARGRIILVGDHKQLPHTLEQELERQLELAIAGEAAAVEMVRARLRESLFQRLYERFEELHKRGGPRRTVRLDTQFRMTPALGELVSRCFYEGGLRSALPAERFAHELPGLEGRSAAWIEVSGPHDQSDGKSRARACEARGIAAHLKRMIDAPGGRRLSFGVITFYRTQKAVLERELVREGLMERAGGEGYVVAEPYRGSANGEPRIRVGTVDAFQGREFDVVYLSLVRSRLVEDGSPKAIQRGYGRLTSPNLLCVAMSRQKRLLIAVSSPDIIRGPSAAAIGPLVELRRLAEAQHGVIV